MNKRILLSSISIFSSLALVTGATFAFFSDVGTSSDNVFAAGTLDLKLTDDDETDLDSVTATFGGITFGGNALGPGACTTLSTLTLQNTGTVAGNHAEVAVVNTVTDVFDDASPDMDRFLRLNVFEYDDVPIVVPSTNATAFADLHDLATAGLDNLSLTDFAEHRIDLQVCLDASAPNEVQGDSVDSDWTITLNQDASQ